MKCQNLFSGKNKKKKNCHLLICPESGKGYYYYVPKLKYLVPAFVNMSFKMGSKSFLYEK